METVHASIVPGLVVVDGPIGAGKTTLINRLKEELTEKGACVAVVKEVIPEDLDAYYADPEANAFEFQKRFVSILAHQFHLMSNLLESGTYDYVLCDRYYASTRGFIYYQQTKGWLTEEQVSELEAMLYLLIHADPRFPEFFIYLSEPAATCMERIGQRGRPGELNTDTLRLMETNNALDMYNSMPYVGFGPDTLTAKLGKLATRLCPQDELSRVARGVKVVYLTDVERNTTRARVLPQRERIELSHVLTFGRTFRRLRHQLLQDALLAVGTRQSVDELVRVTPEEDPEHPPSLN